jgi:hypothetical protein
MRCAETEAEGDMHRSTLQTHGALFGAQLGETKVSRDVDDLSLELDMDLTRGIDDWAVIHSVLVTGRGLCAAFLY